MHLFLFFLPAAGREDPAPAESHGLRKSEDPVMPWKTEAVRVFRMNLLYQWLAV